MNIWAQGKAAMRVGALVSGLSAAGTLVACEQKDPGNADGEANKPSETPKENVDQLAGASLHLLRTFEYENALNDLFGGGLDFGEELAEDLVRNNFSAVSAARDCYSATSVEARERIALHVAQQVFARDETPLSSSGCAPTTSEDDCLIDFVRNFGKRAFRRPLAEEEVTKYLNLIATTSAIYNGDVKKGVEMMVAGIIQSPFFLYRVELGEPVENEGEVRAYTPHEMASRLAFTIWESAPDAELVAAADAGQLSSAESVREQATRMLADPRSNAALVRFWVEHLNIDRLTLTHYPRENATEELYAALRAEGRWLAEQITRPGRNVLDFLTLNESYVNEESARLYGMDAPSDSEFAVLDLPENRKGFLTSGAFLGTQAHTTKTSPVRRGQFILERLLCLEVPPPPSDVDVALPEVSEGQATLRQQLELHRESPACFGCHQEMDPLGFAFEHYDQMGAYRTMDNGLPVDATVDFRGEFYESGLDLASFLRNAEEVPRCLTRQSLANLTGSIFGDPTTPQLLAATEEFVSSGNDYRSLVAALVSSDAFRFANGYVEELSAPEEEE